MRAEGVPSGAECAPEAAQTFACASLEPKNPLAGSHHEPTLRFFDRLPRVDVMFLPLGSAVVPRMIYL